MKVIKIMMIRKKKKEGEADQRNGPWPLLLLLLPKNIHNLIEFRLD